MNYHIISNGLANERPKNIIFKNLYLTSLATEITNFRREMVKIILLLK